MAIPASARRKPLRIGGQRIPLGATRDIQLPVGESYLGSRISVPVRVIRAKRRGPRVFVTGAVHGDELNGMGIIRRLMYEELPVLQRGTLIMVPVVNVSGLENHMRYLPDRRDLNRSFPGSSTGAISSRLADVMYTEVISQCDLGIDFHSAAVRRTNYPNVRADMRNPEVKKLARAFGSELIVNSKGPDGSLRRTAVKAGVPTIILEAGEVWKVEPGVLEMGIRGTLNVLKHYGMIGGKPVPPLFQKVLDKTVWVRAEHGGILDFHAKPGDFVRAGQILATNFNIFGREQRMVESPVDGIILGMTTMPAVNPGGPIFHIATASWRSLARIQKKVDEYKRHTFTEMQEHLATNVALAPSPDPQVDRVVPDLQAPPKRGRKG